MTTTDLLDPVEWPRAIESAATATAGTAATFTLATHKVAHIYTPVRDGVIDKFSVRLTTVTTGDTLTGSVETLNTSDEPTGSLVAAGASGTLAVTGADAGTWIEFTLTTPVTVAAGTPIALVVSNGAVPGSMLFGRMSGTAPFTAVNRVNMRVKPFTTSWQGAHGAGCLCAVSYQTGGYHPINNAFTYAPGTFFSTESFNSGTNPDERGNLITMPADMRIVGVGLTVGGAADYRFRVYDTSDNVLAETTVDGSISDTPGIRYIYFDPIDLTKSTQYRFVAKATTGSNVQLSAQAIQGSLAAAFQGGANWSKTTRNDDTGSWTDTSNTRYNMVLMVGGVQDVSTGGGEKTVSFIN